MKWYQQSWLGTAVALFLVIVSTVAVRVQLRISREQRLWDERKTLYVDLLREQGKRHQDVGGFVVAQQSVPAPEDSPDEKGRRAAYELLGARTAAFASRKVVNAEFNAVLGAQDYTFALMTTREGEGGNATDPVAEERDPAVIAARQKWIKAEDRLIRQIRGELAYQRYRWWRAPWHRITAHRRPPTAPNF